MRETPELLVLLEADACEPGKEPAVASTCGFPSRLAESSVRKNGTVSGFFLLHQS